MSLLAVPDQGTETTAGATATPGPRPTAARHPWWRVMLVLAALLGGLAPALVTTPAHAAPVCGAWKTVRVSIHYQACNEAYADGVVFGMPQFQNNHGGSVLISVQYGRSVNGGAVGWLVSSFHILPAGRSSGLYRINCTPGQSIRAVVRVFDTNTNQWGPGSFATAVRCPN